MSVAPQPESYAWWLRAEYYLFGSEVRGIPVAMIRANWCKANEFRKDLFLPDPSESLRGDDRSFAIDGVFDGSKTSQAGLVGVYETCKGEKRCVPARPGFEDKPPAIRFVLEIPGEHEFALVYQVDAFSIGVYHCMECDHVSKLKWNRKTRTFVLLPPDPGE